MENKLTPELIEKAKQAKSAEELIALAKENGAELSAEEANTYFAQLHKTGELDDDELDNVAGGDQCGTLYNDDGWPVITVLNSCEHYQNENTWKKDDGDGYCRSCRYSKDCDGLLICKCEMRKYN